MSDVVRKSEEILTRAVEDYDNPVILWTGGKDSSVALHLAQEMGLTDVPALFIDTGAHFDTVLKHVGETADELGVNLVVAEARDEIRSGDVEWCCSRNKTLPLHESIERHGFDAVVSAIRWDECEARSDETYISPRVYSEPLGAYSHDRIHPILHWTLDDVWSYINHHDVPVNPLYREGYTSLGCAPCTELVDDGSERGGRAQDKEQVMHRLREWK